MSDSSSPAPGAQLRDRVALVTGAGSGIGRAQARLFASEGAAVVVADLDRERAQTVAQEIVTFGGRALAVQMDVADADSVAESVDEALSHFGPIELLSNTAGMFDGFRSALKTSREHWDRVLAVNLTGLFLVTQAVVPSMVEREFGRIVTISSGAGLRGGGGGAAYTASKHGAIGFTKHLAAHYGRHGVRANVIAPGMIDTPMVAGLPESPAGKALAGRIPAGRAGTAEEVAQVALFLLGDGATYIHGTVVSVDGGQVDVLNVSA